MPNIHATYCNLLPIEKKKIVLYSTDEKYSGGCKYLAEEFLHRNATCKLVWVSERQRVETPEGICSVCGYYAMRHQLATANVIIADGRLNTYWAGGYIRKPGQAYFQVRHEGGLGPKKLGADLHEPDIEVLKQNKIDSQRTVVLLSGSKWESENLVSSYYYWRPPTEWGNPCNDALVHFDALKKIARAKMGIDANIKIALYAPTRRDWKGAKSFPKPDYAQVIAALEKRFGGEWVIFVRRHPLLCLHEMSWILPENEVGVRDVSDYPDSTELLSAADVLISDYSTCAFDYLLTRKPVFLYVPDEKEYAQHHGLYYPLREAPMTIACCNVELLNAIKEFNKEQFDANVEQFMKQRGNKDDGKACDRIVGWILSKTLAEPAYDLSATRKGVLRCFRKSLWERFYSHRILSIDYQKFKILGISLKCPRQPIPPKNPYNDLPIQHNKIVLRNIQVGYSGNPKYIVEELQRRGLPYDVVWCIGVTDKAVLKNIHHYPKTIRLVMTGTEEASYEFSTAKVWIDTTIRCYQYRQGLVKRKDQFYLQFWHASFGIKKPIFGQPLIEKIWGRPAESQIDYLISNSDCESEHYLKPVFQFRGVKRAPILKLGHPRSDIFYTSDEEKERIRTKVYRELGIHEDRKLLLWAPTWRDDLNTDWVSLDYESVRNALATRFGGKWEIATRMHHMMVEQKKEFENENHHIINASDYVDVQELLVAADVMISDYSSIVCDFILMDRPAFLYVPDYEEYGMTRELAYPLHVTPCPIATTNADLMREIEHFDAESYAAKLRSYLRKMGCVEDGHAAERVVDLIEKLAPLNHELHL